MDLKTERIKKNLTQEEVANFIGVSVNAYRSVESGNSVPKLARIEKLDKLIPGAKAMLLERKEMRNRGKGE